MMLVCIQVLGGLTCSDVWQENEKLYLELKAEKSRSRAQQDAMFQERHGLMTQLTLSRSG